MTDPQEIVVEQRVHAVPATVYAYLTDSDRWARWQGDEATVDARPGGLFRMQMGTGQTARGQFIDLVPDRRIVFSWGWVDMPGIPPGSTTVEIELLADGDGTLVRLTHRALPPDEVDSHRSGWRHYLRRLGLRAEGVDPGPDPGPDAGPDSGVDG